MIPSTKALLLIGSPKPYNSTSESLGSYLVNQLDKKGVKTDNFSVYAAIRSDEKLKEMLALIDSSDVIILSFPLYVDSLPAGVIRAFEIILERKKKAVLPPSAVNMLRQLVDLIEKSDLAAALTIVERILASVPVIPAALRWVLMIILGQLLKRQRIPPQTVKLAKDYINRVERKRQKLAVIVNSGFPETHQNDISVAICKQFAEEAGFEWLGALELGAGSAIAGKPLDKAGGMARNVGQAFDIAADDIANGRSISEEAIELMSKPMMPTWMYILFGGLGWRLQALKNKVWWKLHRRPYERT